MKDEKVTIAVDFDGVLHSFSSGWTSARDIPDPPTEGAILWLRYLIYSTCVRVVIFSARNHKRGGKRAIKRWLRKHGLTRREIRKIGFPYLKPPCQFLLDDRAVCFRGEFPTCLEIVSFKPWHGKEVW